MFRLQVCLVGLLVGLATPLSAGVDVTGLRTWQAPDRTRLVFELSAQVSYEVFSLSHPTRLVLDLPAAQLKMTLPAAGTIGPIIKTIRSGEPADGILRLVFDLDTPVAFRVFMVAAVGGHMNRMVIDLYPRDEDGPDSKAPVAKMSDSGKNYVVVIDAGHGGEDPGALGYLGLKEKDVVLNIARRLARLIDEEPGMSSILTRTGDYYLRLRRRIDIARRAEAALFVSIHADAFSSRSASGASVYSLSQSGATNEMAAYLAQRENAADLAGGVSLSDRDEDLAEVMLDMQLDWKIEESRLLGTQLLLSLATLGPLHSRHVEQAGFVVLKAPAIPSVLVETGYVTHPRDSKRLQTPGHLERLAAALFRGILNYCYLRPGCPLPQTVSKTHVVKPGDSLSGIAARYGTNVGAIKRRNGLQTDVIQVRQRLFVPVAIP
jgi:N-acetylmuramoyl-L-alanine amidase